MLILRKALTNGAADSLDLRIGSNRLLILILAYLGILEDFSASGPF